MQQEHIISPLPDEPSVVSDLVGYAVRWVRANFRFLFKTLIYPVVLYVAIWEAIQWLVNHSGSPYFGIMISLCLVFLVAITYELGVRQIAFWSLFAGRKKDYGGALKVARHPVILILFLPVLVLELLLVFLLFLLLPDLHAQATKGSHLYVLIVIFGLLLFSCPYSFVALWNSLLACFVETEQLSLVKATGRILNFQLKSPVLFIWAMGFFATIDYLIEASLELGVSLIMLLPGIATGFTHVLLEWITIIFKVIAMSVLQVFLFGFRIAAATCIYNEFRMRLEGADITRSISAIRHEQSNRSG